MGQMLTEITGENVSPADLAIVTETDGSGFEYRPFRIETRLCTGSISNIG